MSEYTDVMAEFKNNLCDENQKVREILKVLSQKYPLHTILDIGSGLGDITAMALPEHNIIHLDTEDYSDHTIPVAHQREIGDFLKYTPSQEITTLFMCHVIQYIDDDMEVLQAKIDEIDPEYILLTLDKNDDFLGVLAQRSLTNIPTANPELSYPGFPAGYDCIETIDYTGQVQAASWEDLLKSSMCVLIDVAYTDLSDELKHQLMEFTRSHLTSPAFTINQGFHVYQKIRGK